MTTRKNNGLLIVNGGYTGEKKDCKCKQPALLPPEVVEDKDKKEVQNNSQIPLYPAGIEFEN